MMFLKEEISRAAGNGTLDVAAAGSSIAGVGVALPPPSAIAVFNDTAPPEQDGNRTEGEMQYITCVGTANLTGTFTMSFNGETTAPLGVIGLSGVQVIDALQALRTVGDMARVEGPAAATASSPS